MLAIAAILIAVWFYHSARKAGKDNVWRWVGVGVVSYYAAGIVWVYAILPLILGRRLQMPSASMGIMIELSGIFVALLVVAWIRLKWLSEPIGKK